MSRRRYPYDYEDLFGRPPRPVAPRPHPYLHVSDRPTPSPAPAPAPAPNPTATPQFFPEPPAPAAPIAPTNKQDLRAALDDLQAAKARVEREAARVLAQTRRDLVRDLLPVLDNLERSIAAGDATDPEASAVLDGVNLVRDQFEKVLRSYGVERIASVGTQFDPAQHEAIAIVPTTDPRRDNEIVDEWEPGYRMDDTVLRVAKVRVAKAA